MKVIKEGLLFNLNKMDLKFIIYCKEMIYYKSNMCVKINKIKKK